MQDGKSTKLFVRVKTAVLGAMAVACLGSSAFAQESGFYAKAFGGFTWPQSKDFNLNDRVTGGSIDSGFDYKSGGILGLGAGFEVSPSLAFEAEYAYRKADAKLRNSGDDKGKTESNAFMVNALYKFQPLGQDGAWRPYAGGGLGVANLNIEKFDLGSDLDSDYQLAYQLMGGVGYSVSPKLTLLGEARFFGINDQNIKNDDWELKSTYHTIDLIFGASYAF